MLILGASHAGVLLAATLRENGWEEPITIVGEEPSPPYQRPPLSKGLIAGEVEPEDLALRSFGFFRDAEISLELGSAAVAVDPAGREVTLSDGRRLRYGCLALATGATARPAPFEGADLDGVAVLRTLSDALMLRERIAAAGEVVIVGAGYIGLELSAGLAALGGRHVTVVDCGRRILARAASATLATFVAERHRHAGTRLILGARIARLNGAGGRVTDVELADGSRIAADLVVLAIGVRRNDHLARVAGLACDDGVLVNRAGRTSDPRIVALGDCAVRHSRFADGALVRLECVQNAQDGARAAAAGLTGKPVGMEPTPWFWSDQLGLRLQTAGLTSGVDRTVQRGSREQGRFSLWHFAGPRLRAVETVNAPAEHLVARKLLQAGCPISPAEAADTRIDLGARFLRREMALSAP
ncbi:NAD(P)/FAD-dependent oxidoreductase [Arenibaculum pallidiluteum]|uniref:NAD(P)/FAD-dependent oxidoreductase n=1 Tax=Arenibaculum pallidiluteum TaxID=2812559 RepID=UPI001A97CF7E|nr:FAD-dependent oxidoreductase [Arenibaculum pallidiluteum]